MLYPLQEPIPDSLRYKNIEDSNERYATYQRDLAAYIQAKSLQELANQTQYNSYVEITQDEKPKKINTLEETKRYTKYNQLNFKLDVIRKKSYWYADTFKMLIMFINLLSLVGTIALLVNDNDRPLGILVLIGTLVGWWLCNQYANFKIYKLQLQADKIIEQQESL